MGVTKANITKDIEKLRLQILELNKQYELGTPLVEDYIYDFYKKKLAILEEDAQYKISEIIGTTPNENKARHLYKILSLQHDFGKKSFDEFITRIEKIIAQPAFPLIAELKVDGVSVIVRYENGILKRIATRGNGIFGEDITHLKDYLNLPNEIFIKELIEIRFEAYMEKDIIKNPRNATAGLLLKKKADSNLKHIKFMPHNLYTNLYPQNICQTYLELRDIFEKMHLDILPIYKKCENKADMEEFFDEIDSKKNDLPFEIDGVVFKINDFALYEKLGETAIAPKYAFAVKFENTFAISVIQDIKFQVGRFGRLTPVAEIEETEIVGRKIKRATLNNFMLLKEKNYAVGDIVKIEMAGEVIPMISQIIQKSENSLIIPTRCPACDSILHEDVCMNAWACIAQRKERLYHFASKHGLDIANMGEKQIEFFMEMQMLEYPYDFFEIKNRINEITYNPSWLGEKALANLLEAIEKSRYKTLAAWYTCLGILHIGRAKAQELADKFPNFEDFLAASIEQLEFLGPEISKDVYNFKQTETWLAKTYSYMKIGQEYKNESVISLF